MDEVLKRDQNFVTVLAGVTDDSDKDITMLRVDPITKRLLVKADISGLSSIYLKLDQTTPQTIINGSPLLTGFTPTSDYQIATKKYVDDAVLVENLWDRTGTVLTPHNVGDDINLLSGKVSFTSGVKTSSFYGDGSGSVHFVSTAIVGAGLHIGDLDKPSQKLIFSTSTNPGIISYSGKVFDFGNNSGNAIWTNGLVIEDDDGVALYRFPIDNTAAINYTGRVLTNSGIGGTMTWLGDLNIGAKNIYTDTTTGTRIGTATNQKLGFFNATPVVQQLSATDLGVTLSNLGLRAAGTDFPITTTGNITAGQMYAGNINYNEGLLADPVITDATGSAVAITSVDCLIRTDAIWDDGKLYRFTVPATASLPLTDETINYIYVDYNSGTPIYAASTDRNVLNNSNQLPVARVSMSGGNIEYQITYQYIGKSAAIRNFDRVMRIRGSGGIERESGMNISETGTRVINISSGFAWFGLKRVTDATLIAIAQGGVGVTSQIWYHSAGVWTEAAITAYNNTQYDNGTNLVTLTANRYAVNWVFRNISTNEIDVVLGTGDYTLAQAEASMMPSLPAQILNFYVLCGRIIVQKNSNTAQSIENVSTTIFNQSAVSLHNELEGLQGGVAGEYYHMTSAQNTALGTFITNSGQGATFGGGIDGTGTYNSAITTTLQRSYYYTNATLSNSAIINTNGWFLCGNGTLTINSGCSVNWNGTNGVSASSASGASAPSSVVGHMASVGVGQYATAGAGVSGSITNGTSSSSSQGGSGMCGAGGKGGNGGNGSSGTGGTGANAGTVTYVPLDIMSLSLFTYNYYGASFTTIGTGSGGSGGGGGGGSGTFSGGGGGSGGNPGGFCVICFPTIVNSGSIQANGGRGGNGYQGAANNCGGGGSGGGGSAGVVWMIYLTYSGAGTITASGGVGGTPGAAGGGSGLIGGTGGTGSNGYVRRFNLTTGVVSTS